MGVGYVLGEACQDPASPHTVRGPVPHGRPGGCLLALLAVSGNKAVLEKGEGRPGRVAILVVGGQNGGAGPAGPGRTECPLGVGDLSPED